LERLFESWQKSEGRDGNLLPTGRIKRQVSPTESALIDLHSGTVDNTRFDDVAAQAPFQGRTRLNSVSRTPLSAMAVPPLPTSGPSRAPSTGSAVLISAAMYALPSIRSPHGPGETMSETLGSTVVHPPPTSGPSRAPSTGSAVLISAEMDESPSIRSPHVPGETMSETLGSTVVHPPSSIHSWALSTALALAAHARASSTTDVGLTKTSGF
jgi:hypothetical protein